MYVVNSVKIDGMTEILVYDSNTFTEGASGNSPFVSFSLSRTRRKASGARTCPAFTSNDLFILIVPESAFLA